MKFVVRREVYNNDVEVRLHDDTKDKIKNVLIYAVVTTASFGYLTYAFAKRKPQEESTIE